MIDGRVEFSNRRQAEKWREIQRFPGFQVARENCYKVQFVLNREVVERSGVFAGLKFIHPAEVNGQPGVRSIVNSLRVKVLHGDKRFAERNQVVYITQPGVKVNFQIRSAPTFSNGSPCKARYLNTWV